MPHPTKTEDQWKKFNQLCRDKPALAAKINSDPVVIGLLLLMSGYLEAVPNVPLNIVKQIQTAAPMPKALYFGTPCPFHVPKTQTPNDLQHAFIRALGWFDTAVDVVLGAFEKSFLVEALQTVNHLLTTGYTSYTQGHTARVVSLCAAWEVLCAALRERVWTLARIEAATKATSSFRVIQTN